MRTLGLMGGTDYKSTVKYLESINDLMVLRYGQAFNCQTVTYNLSQADLKHFNREVIYYCDILRQSGANLLVLCDQSLHTIAKDIRRNLSIPIIHIGESLAKVLKQRKINKVLVVGDRESMQADYYVDALNRAGIKVAIPPTDLINSVQDYLHGHHEDALKVISMIESYRVKGVSGVIFTQDMNIDESELSMYVFKSFEIHVDIIVEELARTIEKTL